MCIGSRGTQACGLRVLVLCIGLMSICVPLGASAVAANDDAWKCPPSTKIPGGVGPGVGEVMLVCKAGKAIVKTASGVSHRLAPSTCFIGASGARLHFGSYPWAKDSNRSQSLYIVVDRRANSRNRADIVDGGLRLLRPHTHVTTRGTAILRDGLKSGTFTIVVKGKNVTTGQWDCGAGQ
jgi:hypothetical protein